MQEQSYRIGARSYHTTQAFCREVRFWRKPYFSMQDSTLPHVFTLGKVWKCHPENVCIKAMTILCFWPESQIRVIVTRIIIKASSTLRASRAVPHPGTDRALRRLTSEFGRDPVHSTRYGRWQEECSRGVARQFWEQEQGTWVRPSTPWGLNNGRNKK